jgi:hypothetical protein
MGNLVSNLFLLFSSFIITLLPGILISNLFKSESLLSKIVLAFAFGFGIISVVGIISSVIGIESFIYQLIVVAIIALGSIIKFRKKQIKSIHLIKPIVDQIKEYKIIFFFSALAALILVYFFSQIAMWTAGDGTFHSTIIRMINEGEKIPINLISPGGNFDQYPKGFHFYLAFFTKLFGFDVIRAMKILPILILILISTGIFAIVDELNFPKPMPSYAFMISFALWKHFYPLIWMGYPQLTADFFIVVLILAMILESKKGYPKYSFFIFLMLYLIHPRHFLYTLPIISWMLISKSLKPSLRNLYLAMGFSFGLISLILIILARLSFPGYPAYITRLLTGVESLSEFVFIWNIGLLAIFGIYFSLKQRSQEDLLLILIFFSWLFMAMLIDTSTFRIDIPDKRSYSKLFIPISMFTASLFYKLTNSLRRKKISYYLVAINTFLIFFLLISSAFINAPILGWIMSENDYFAIKSLEGKSGIAINVDPTGRWIYPLVGMKVTNPRAMAQILNNSDLEKLILHPNSEETARIMDDLKSYGDVYIFISERTLKKPGYFLFDLTYPSVNVEELKNSERYKVIYNEGALIYRYINAPNIGMTDE